MGIGLDVEEFLVNAKALKPPYQCPVVQCGRIYKSYTGFEHHLYLHNEESGGDRSLDQTGTRKTGLQENISGCVLNSGGRDMPLSYADSQRMVEVDVDGKVYRLNIYEPLEIISSENVDDNAIQCPVVSSSKTTLGKPTGVSRRSGVNKSPEPVAKPTLPEAKFRKIEGYAPQKAVPPMPTSYYRYIEKSAEELDEECEYDMDDEDYAWLELINEKREKTGADSVSQDVFELLMDRFEKEAFFQANHFGKESNAHGIDDDAVCTICLDGECHNTNAILFCDICNLAVHQECYGVPYIPEGQWLCRRCLMSPSHPVECSLCPNRGGAFKQTTDGSWAHVVCAIWIPEVCFSNTVFLEPIDGIANIPAARWKLSCFICKQRGVGACIQCHRVNCYTAFHVTCAQQAGLHMKLEAVRDQGPIGAGALSSGVAGSGPSGGGGSPGVSVRKSAYCDQHVPTEEEGAARSEDAEVLKTGTNGRQSSQQRSPSTPCGDVKEQQRLKMRKARRVLAQKRNTTPAVSIPVIPQARLEEVAKKVTLKKKKNFIARLYAYWTLKRQSRYGVPLLRRLQVSHMNKGKGQIKDDRRADALKTQFYYWKRLREDLERARLLLELIRKREKIKREQIKVQKFLCELKLDPLTALLRQTLAQLKEKDTHKFFQLPVSLEEVPQYLEYIEKPMDFSTIQKNVDTREYRTFAEFDADFRLIVSNCMKFNDRESIYWKAATRLRDQCRPILKYVSQLIKKIGFDPTTCMHADELTTLPVTQEILPDIESSPLMPQTDPDSVLPPEVRADMSLEEQLSTLLDKLEELHHNRKCKLAVRIKREIKKIRAQLAQQSPGLSSCDATSSCEENARKSAVSAEPSGEDPDEADAISNASSSSWITADLPSTPTPDTVASEGLSAKSPKSGSKAKKLRRQDPSSPSRNKEDKTSPPVSPKRKKSHARSKADRTGTRAIANEVETNDDSSGDEEADGAAEKNVGELPELLIDPGEEIDEASSEQITPRKRRIRLSSRLSEQDFLVQKSPADKHAFSARGASGSRGFRRGFKRTKGGEGPLSPGAGPRKKAHTGRSAGVSLPSPSASHSGDLLNFSNNDIIPLAPLDLVWAKCFGYPWYPAMVIDPDMSRDGITYHGIDIPAPPSNVVISQGRQLSDMFLVLFFDQKRTWQWLARSKLEPLGVDSGLDKARLSEIKNKSGWKKVVKRAYDRAIRHRCQVTGDKFISADQLMAD